MGHVGLLGSGGVQWMTAGRGVIHSEMPEQQEGTMRGFQLWLNLPAADKLCPPGYRDFAPEEIPSLRTAEGVGVKVIAGRFEDGRIGADGAVQRPQTEPQLFDLQLPAGSQVTPKLAEGLRVMLYVYEGSLGVGDARTEASAGRLLRLSGQGALRLHSQGGARVLLIAGRPLGEPIVQYGPFVMNSREEIEQALRDYRNGSFVEGPY